MRYFVPLYIIILFTSCNHPENVEYGRFRSKSAFANSGISYENEDLFKIIAIKDGDTFVVLFDGREQVVRLEHIDCPEKNSHLEVRLKNLYLICVLVKKCILITIINLIEIKDLLQKSY